MTLRFGTAGIPLSTNNPNTISGIAQVRTLNLDCMELEFVRSVNISAEKAPEVKAVAKKEVFNKSISINLPLVNYYFANDKLVLEFLND